MKEIDLPKRWKEKIQSHLKEIGSKYNSFGANAFHHNLRITLADKSYAFFFYAFYWTNTDEKEIAVFTEHCGYHIFSLIDSKIEVISRDGVTIKTEEFTIK